jgi:hypothetical protein
LSGNAKSGASAGWWSKSLWTTRRDGGHTILMTGVLVV